MPCILNNPKLLKRIQFNAFLRSSDSKSEEGQEMEVSLYVLAITNSCDNTMIGYKIFLAKLLFIPFLWRKTPNRA
jgi:hypothetical protein